MTGGESKLNPTLVVLAAGAGTRYGSLKQLAPIGPGGATLLEYSVFDALRAGFGRVVLVIRPETESVFRDRFDARMAGRIPVAYAHQILSDLPMAGASGSSRVKPWGTGQAVLAAGSEIDGPFAVINADDFYGAESFAALSRFWGERRSGSPALAVVGFRLTDTLSDSGPVSRALCELDAMGHLRDIVEITRVWRSDGRIVYLDPGGLEKMLGEDRLVSMNMWGFQPELLPELRRQFRDFLHESRGADEAEFLLPDVIRSVVREGRFEVEVLTSTGEWCGLTFREDHERVTEFVAGLVARGRYPRELWK
jgi:dTDP-glucose pyrophosphorylase